MLADALQTTSPGVHDERLLRVALGLHEAWWFAAIVGLLCVALIVLLLKRNNRPGDRIRTQRLVLAFGLLTAHFAWAAITLASTAFWTPADDPEAFNRLIAGPNYLLLQEWHTQHEGTGVGPPTIARLSEFAASFGPIDVTQHVQWPYMQDALGRPLSLEAGVLLASSDGRQLPR